MEAVWFMLIITIFLTKKKKKNYFPYLIYFILHSILLLIKFILGKLAIGGSNVCSCASFKSCVFSLIFFLFRDCSILQLIQVILKLGLAAAAFGIK